MGRPVAPGGHRCAMCAFIVPMVQRETHEEEHRQAKRIVDAIREVLGFGPLYKRDPLEAPGRYRGIPIQAE